jgi:hypothetical protein
MTEDEIANWLVAKVKQASLLNEDTEIESQTSLRAALKAVRLLVKMRLNLSETNLSIDDGANVFLQLGNSTTEVAYLIVIWVEQAVLACGIDNEISYYFRVGNQSTSGRGSIETLMQDVVDGQLTWAYV